MMINEDPYEKFKALCAEVKNLNQQTLSFLSRQQAMQSELMDTGIEEIERLTAIIKLSTDTLPGNI